MSADSKLKILFFTPFAGYTGSEVMLFNMLKNMDPQKFETAVFSLQKGELFEALPQRIPMYYYSGNNGLFNRIRNKIPGSFSRGDELERQIMKIHTSFKPDFWYINTLLPINVMQKARKHDIKYAVHFHELQSQYKIISSGEMQNLLSGATFATGCSEGVCTNLKIMGATNIVKQYECIDSASIKVSNAKKQPIRKEINIPEGHKIITMSGQRTDRKGIDLFIEVAKSLRDKPYFFLWLGAAQHTGHELFLEKYIAYNRLTNIAFIHPVREDYYTYLDLADIFFLSSREDPFPLVMLEAAYLGKYIVSLNSGGVKEFITEETGCIINSWNIQDIALELQRCIEKQSGGKNAEKSKENALKYDVSKQVKLFENILINECSR